MTHIAASSTKQNETFSNDTAVMIWSIKTIECSPKELKKAYLAVVTACLLPFLYCLWLLWDDLPEALGMLIAFGCAPVVFGTYLIVFAVRQKAMFNYHITLHGGSVEYYDYYPNFAGPFFKGIAIFTILLFLGVALVTGSLLFLVGPAAISIGAARSLLNWENKIHHRETRPWDTHNFVTIDRKRSIIVIHCTDITTGFFARFPNKDLFEQYLQFLHSVLPPTAEFMEKDWEW
ncbi:permease [Pseudomonas sp. Irchel 3A18]|uniref:permease n=1 Tax=Pseudomonas sp. Irchel 3A18 TaxID=2008905 RepID=UPI000BA2CC88|nr:permease [Pseudomonas sp. Irchel 3A18]